MCFEVFRGYLQSICGTRVNDDIQMAEIGGVVDNVQVIAPGCVERVRSCWNRLSCATRVGIGIVAGVTVVGLFGGLIAAISSGGSDVSSTITPYTSSTQDPYTSSTQDQSISSTQDPCVIKIGKEEFKVEKSVRGQKGTCIDCNEDQKAGYDCGSEIIDAMKGEFYKSFFNRTFFLVSIKEENGIKQVGYNAMYFIKGTSECSSCVVGVTNKKEDCNTYDDKQVAINGVFNTCFNSKNSVKRRKREKPSKSRMIKV